MLSTVIYVAEFWNCIVLVYTLAFWTDFAATFAFRHGNESIKISEIRINFSFVIVKNKSYLDFTPIIERYYFTFIHRSEPP